MLSNPALPACSKIQHTKSSSPERTGEKCESPTIRRPLAERMARKIGAGEANSGPVWVHDVQTAVPCRIRVKTR